ncbi:MmgE/PrpD family protein [Cupriavidus necator]
MVSQHHPGAELCAFVAALRYEHLPHAVVARTEDLFLDWLGCSLAGRGNRAVGIIESYARRMGPAVGPSEVLISRQRTSPYFAALVNAASSNVVEQTDVHNGAVLHAGAVVFPAVLAAAQELGSSGREMITAAVAGYEAGIRVGEYLGRAHYRIFHTTATVGTIAAALAVGRLLQLDATRMLDALGSAGTQAAGLWEFLRDGADSRQLHVAKASADGLLSAYLARDGFTGARRVLDGPQGLGQAMSGEADASRLTDRLGTRWALAETSFKWHACCRHAHPAADALLALMRDEGVAAGQIQTVTALVHDAALGVLHCTREPQSVDQALFSMSAVLSLIAIFGRAGVDELYGPQRTDARVEAFRARVSMVPDAEIDAAYPSRWIGRVRLLTMDGRRLERTVFHPKGDPENTLSRAEIAQKVQRLAALSGAASEVETRRLVSIALDMRAWCVPPALLAPPA